MRFQVAGWVLFVLATIAAARLGIGLAERISPPPAAEETRFAEGLEFDESALSGDQLLLFASQQLLRDHEFKESLPEGGDRSGLAKSDEVKTAPPRFRLKIEGEDGRLVEVRFMEPESMAGERWWIVADRLKAGPSQTMNND